MGKSKEELNQYQATKNITNNRSGNEITNEERHNRNAHESTTEQNYPRINTENL